MLICKNSAISFGRSTETIYDEIKVVDIPCHITQYSETQIMINLNYTIKPCRIMELFEKINNGEYYFS